MSGLAKYLLEEGFEVLGSDISQNKNTVSLEKMGAKIFIGHNADNLPQKAIVVSSTAIKKDNPELVKAKELGFEILHRSDMLARISEGLGGVKKKYFIGYSGTHGKTTTSGLSSYVLSKSGLDPAFVVGGMVPEIGVNSKSANGDFFVAELDESDGTIVKYKPQISVINNLEVDHVDFYTDGMQSILDTFKVYLGNLPQGSKVLINNDCAGNLRLIDENPKSEFTTFGFNQADYVAKNIKFEGKETSFDILFKGEFLTSLKLQLLGNHNVYNALAVLASLNEAGVTLELVKEHFYTFVGMGRRFQLAAEFDGITVYDDYAHHPTEIKATLSSIESFKGKNVVAVFQPHRYSRLKGLWDDFLGAFVNVDRVYVTDVYAASETPIAGVDGELFAQQLGEKISVPSKHLKGSMTDVAHQLWPLLNKNDVVIGLGAGTITNLGKELLSLKKAQEGAKL